MYKKVSTSLDFCEREEEVLSFWKEKRIFEKSVQKNSDEKVFTFYDGPPTANGKPHIGHILTRVIKDIIPRYKTMKGFKVLRKAGWDTHGLPVELEVEKMLGIDGKQEIEKYGIEPFIEKCKESVWKYKDAWERMSDRVGYWADMENPYVTYDNNYIESVWWSLKTVFDRGLLYKGHKIVPYCPRCGTALSSHEVAQGYKDVKDTSIFVKFRKKDAKNTFFLAWTTTPWTLPSNVALCMNPEEDYVEIEAGGAHYILAEALVSALFEDYRVVSKKKGRDYEHAEYLPLFDCYTGDEKAFFVTCDTYVTLTDGSGIVHIAPAFGEDDANVGRKYGLPFVQMVDDRGKFKEEMGELAGVFAKDGDVRIIETLSAQGLLFKKLVIEHSYPHCWRCDTPLLYYARSTWFIKMTEVRDQLLKNNAQVNWIPPTIGTGRMGNFLENVIDWGISRERYWGTPLPIWVCDCGHIHAIGSRQELKQMSGLQEDIELHKPFIDRVTLKCPACGGQMKRTPEVIDCWYDAGSMPFAQWHYPFENKELFGQNFPADFISEAVDQTRGWFYTLLAISTLMFDRAPFKNCIVLGHVNDSEGIKMSKHKGNVVDPWSVLDKQGADAVRWYFYVSSAPWLPSRFSAENVSEVQRKFMGTLWNTYAFFVLYAEIDGYDPHKFDLKKCALTLMDRWILSKLNTLIDFVDRNLSEYKITESARAAQDFVDELSNWYVRRSRDRFWGSEMSEDKAAAYTTLHHVLVTLSKLLAPFVPFMSEQIYSNLVTPFFKDAPESVHLTDYPVCDKTAVNEALEQDMAYVLDAVVLGRAARNKANIKNRQPLSVVYIKSSRKVSDAGILELIEEEINCKQAIPVQEEQAFITFELKPQLKTLGKKYGKLIQKIREHLAEADADADAIVRLTEGGGTYRFEADGESVELTLEDLLISKINRPGFVAESDLEMTVILDTNLNEALLKEGAVREIVSKIQTMRKDAGFEVTDHIEVGYLAAGRALEVLEASEQIAEDVLAKRIGQGLIEGAFTKELDINGDAVTISVKKI